MEIEVEIVGNATTTASESHEICSLAGGMDEAFVPVGEARLNAGTGDLRVIGDSGELLGQSV